MSSISECLQCSLQMKGTPLCLTDSLVQQVSPEGADASAYMAANSMYAQAPNFPNAQHISVSPAAVGVQHPSPDIMVQVPYAQYVVDTHGMHAQHMQPGSHPMPPAHAHVVSHPA
jgi:hypothetical protein